MIYAEIPDANPWLTGLGVVLGVGRFGLAGVVLGPLLASVPFLCCPAEQLNASKLHKTRFEWLALSKIARGYNWVLQWHQALKTHPTTAGWTVGDVKDILYYLRFVFLTVLGIGVSCWSYAEQVSFQALPQGSQASMPSPTSSVTESVQPERGRSQGLLYGNRLPVASS